MQWLGLVDLDAYAANLEQEEKAREAKRLARLLHAPEQEKVGGLLFFLNGAADLSVRYNEAIRENVTDTAARAQAEAARAQARAAARAKVEAAKMWADQSKADAKAARDKAKADAKAAKARAAADAKAAKQKPTLVLTPAAPPPAPLVIPVMSLPRDPIARSWRGLGYKKRMEWYALGQRMARFGSRSVEYGLTGPEAFRSVNRVREALFAARLFHAKPGEAALLCDAPVSPVLPPPLSGEYILTVQREGGCYGPLRAHIVCAKGYAGPVRVEFGRPENLENLGDGDRHTLDVVPRLETGETDITALLREQRGTPRVGTKVVAHLTPLSPEGFVNFRVTIITHVVETAAEEEVLRAA